MGIEHRAKEDLQLDFFYHGGTEDTVFFSFLRFKFRVIVHFQMKIF